MSTFEGRLTTGPNRDVPIYHSSGRVARRWDRTVRTLDRWIAAGLFPKPDVVIRDKRYWTDETLNRFDEQQKARAG
jgi:2-hydroxychromene-2-carboxylate isomerase